MTKTDIKTTLIAETYSNLQVRININKMRHHIIHKLLFLSLVLTLMSSFKTNDGEQEIWYTCVKLDSTSQKSLYDYAKANNPWPIDSFYYSCDHVTIYHKSDITTKNRTWSIEHDGDTIYMTATMVGYTDKAFAAWIETTVPITSGVPHVTLAVNQSNGGQAYMSKFIKRWNKLKHKIPLRGVVTINYVTKNSVDK